MENKDILNALQNYEMTFGTAENIFNGGLLTDAERDFVMRDSNAFLFGLIADQSVKAETAWSLPYKLAQRLGHFSMQKIAKESSSEEIGTLLRTKTALHRYPGNMGRYLWSAAERLTSEYDGHGDRRAVGGVLWNQPQKGFTCLFAALARFGCRNIR